MSFPFNKGAAPDLPEYGHEFLVKARNVYAGVLGYEPIKAMSALTPAVGSAWKGSGAFKGSDGTTALIVGTDAGLYRATSTTSTNVHSDTYTGNWFFAQFGDDVICVNGAAPLKYSLLAGTAATLGGSPPSASMVAIVRDFVFMDGGSSHQNRVVWSAINDAESYSPGTGQSDVQDLPDGGPLTGLAGGEYGLAFQDEAIHLFEYVGSSQGIFSRRKVSSSIGAMCHGGIGQHGLRTFFYSRRGFYEWNPNQPEPIPIGRNKWDRTFRETYSEDDIKAYLRCSIDPQRSVVTWSMPGKLWSYNWDNEMFSDVADPGIVGISTGRTASLTLEDIAVIFPSIEDVTPTLDDPFWSGGRPLLMISKSDQKFYAFGASSNLQAEFRLPQLELNPGRISHIRNARVLGNSDQAQVSIDCMARMGATPINTTSNDLRANGELPIRASGRFVQPEVIFPATATWTSVQGFDLEATAGGRQ